jgi:hypothetical protein
VNKLRVFMNLENCLKRDSTRQYGMNNN